MSTIGSEPDDAADHEVVEGTGDRHLPGDPSLWDEEWLPEWVNLEDDAAAPVEDEPERPDPEVQQQLAADLEAVERLVASLLTESSAAFEASVGGWEPDDAPEPEPRPEPASGLSSVGFSMGIARPVPRRAPLPQEPPPSAPVPSVPAVVSPPPPRRRLGWLVAPLVLLLAGAVVGTFLWAGSSRRPTPAAAVHTGAELGTSSPLPTWSRPSGSSPTEPVPVTTAATSTSAPVTSIPAVHRAVRRAASSSATHTSARPTVTSPDLPAPTATAPSPSPTDGSGNPATCSSDGNTDSTPTQTTEPTPTQTETATPTETTSATGTTTQTTTQTATETTASQPSLAAAASCPP